MLLSVLFNGLIAECTGPIFTKFSEQVHIWVGIINQTFFSQLLTGCC